MIANVDHVDNATVVGEFEFGDDCAQASLTADGSNELIYYSAWWSRRQYDIPKAVIGRTYTVTRMFTHTGYMSLDGSTRNYLATDANSSLLSKPTQLALNTDDNMLFILNCDESNAACEILQMAALPSTKVSITKVDISPATLRNVTNLMFVPRTKQLYWMDNATRIVYSYTTDTTNQANGQSYSSPSFYSVVKPSLTGSTQVFTVNQAIDSAKNQSFYQLRLQLNADKNNGEFECLRTFNQTTLNKSEIVRHVLAVNVNTTPSTRACSVQRLVDGLRVCNKDQPVMLCAIGLVVSCK
jgi:hypothetical protein